MLPIVLVAFYLLFYMIYQDIKERTINEFNTEQLILAQTAGQGISNFFKDFQANMQFMAELPAVAKGLSERDSVLFNFYKRHKDLIEAVSLIDNKGRIINTFPENRSVIGRDITYQEHVREILATHQPVISDVFTAAQGYQAIAMHVPVFQDTSYRGSIAILISIDKLGKIFLGKIKVRGTGKVWMLSQNNVELYCTVPGHKGKHFLSNNHQDSASAGFLEKIRRQKSGTAMLVLSDSSSTAIQQNIEKYVVFSRTSFDNSYWTIVISYHQKDVFASLTKLRNRLGLTFLILFIILSYYFYSIANFRKVIREEEKRKIAEKTLKESEEKFRTMFEKSPIGMELYRADGLQVDANPASLSMFGISGFSEVSGFNLFEGTSLDEQKCQLLKRGEVVIYQSEFDFDRINELGQYQTAKTGKAYFDYIITPLFKSGSKSISGFLLQVQDITERIQNEKELIQAKERASESDRLKSAFLANMSHEIRTPMNGILGFAALLKEPNLNPAEQQRYIHIIEKSGERMLNIINDILDISKIEAGLMKTYNTSFDLVELVEFVHQFFLPETESKGLKLSMIIDLESRPCIIETDREKLYAVLINLMKNAIKFTVRGSVELRVVREKGNFQFSVTDTGVGIPESRQAAIFERFIQADLSDKAANQGAGLGLAITKAFVEMLGGRIRVESRVGTGSVFLFTLPVSPVNKS
jgi:PAS domain S-box-containing protein